MASRTGLWHLAAEGPRRIAPSGAPREADLEDWVEREPDLLETKLLVIGRQVSTSFGGRIDLLGLDDEGTLHVLELKRDKTPRDIIAQALDYASWASELSFDALTALYAEKHSGEALAVGWANRFGEGSVLPEQLNVSHQITIVATGMDASTERIVEYLASRGVSINVALFGYFEHEGDSFLTRTWVVDDDAADGGSIGGKPGRATSAAAWNGRDWYVSFGDESTVGTGRDWMDARQFGFVSAGGGAWYSRTLRNLPVGARIFVHVPKRGYVGVGTVSDVAQPATSATLSGRAMKELPLVGRYWDDDLSQPGDVEDEEWVVGVQWLATRSLKDAIWRTGFFANQNSATKLRQQFTIDELEAAFELSD